MITGCGLLSNAVAFTVFRISEKLALIAKAAPCFTSASPFSPSFKIELEST